ncbi:gephyrin-like molybdotransferase Glp [Alcanivorax sp. 1008]|uniref:molybdopterin molybdotransferase MoeA n=1 Tax=Alcanivorax sp. 1008 TaxID=2816853 RepID=UPI001E0B7B10|nr:gephyrin-like molybdotransferase Glp [Alcanivorax sp. 1008]MCC1495932.1 molybdopterin molybdotransferase MoeA [Alcanivorax sp. 1008]
MACHDEPGMLPLEVCRARLLDSVTAINTGQSVSLTEAIGRVTSEAITAAHDVPPADNSAMDGYAIHQADLHSKTALTLIGSSFAGHPFNGTLQPGQCVRIMTGANVPEGAAAVIMQEQVLCHDDLVSLQRELQSGENIRRRGEDIRASETLLPAGRRLRAADIGLLASQGIATVKVQRRLRVALISTGDELVPAGQPLGPGQIYDSNRAMLQAALSETGFTVIDMGHVADNAKALRQRFLEADASADAVITSGGVSVGEADLVRQVVGDIGDIHIWKVAIKPGKPFAFGKLPNSVFFGLPGNPVSALVTLMQLAMPALLSMQGNGWQAALTMQAKLQAPIKKKPGRADYQRGIVSQSEDGELLVTPLGNQGSGVLTSMSKANCFIVLGQDQGSVSQGEYVTVEPFNR